MNTTTNQKAIIRATNAGVFYGEIESRNGNEVNMKNVRRIWYWSGGAIIQEILKRIGGNTLCKS